MRIFLSGTSFLPNHGGPAYSVSRLALALAGTGAEIGLWSADGSVTDTPLLATDAPITRLDGAAADALARFRPNLVHDNGIWLAHNHLLACLCRRAAIPRIVSPRGMLEPWARRHKKWKKDIAWLVYQRHDLATACSLHATAAQEADNLTRLKLGVPIHMISNGVDVPPPCADGPPSGCVKTALFLGRLYPVKGLSLLIEAWDHVRPSGWRLVLAGPDESGHRAELEALIDQHRLRSVISFAGPLHGAEKRHAMFSADLFVLPSHSESFGMVIAEALAHGLPVLTTMGAPWPALTEHAMGWRTSISAHGLAEALSQATTLDSLALQAMGNRGRAFVAAQFGWDEVARRLLMTYAATVATSAAPSCRAGIFS